MVNVLVFTPAKEQVEYLQALVQKTQTNELHIDVVHCFGDPEAHRSLEEYDVLLARGITYHMLCSRYPEKQICEISFDGMDILDALLRCRDTYHPRKIGICLKQNGMGPLLYALSELCGAKILLYNVEDEQSAFEAVNACVRDGVEAVVAGGSVSELCSRQGIPCTYIPVQPSTLEHALEDVLYTARNINTRRTNANMIRMILDNNSAAVLAVDEMGRILEANEQACRLYQLDLLDGWQGGQISAVHPGLTYIGNPAMPCQNGSEAAITLNGEPYAVRYKLISGALSGTGTLIITTRVAKPPAAEEQARRLINQGLTARYTFRDIIAVSEELQKKVIIAKKFSQAQSNVLITGETGTGKELFAHSIHAASGRMNRPFVAINCATLPESLLESELFGYEPGAFSGASREGKVGLFELADHGTLFLDEIGEIPVALQAKLLRVLQEKEIRRIGSNTVIPVDVRVIAATNINIQEQIAEGRFRRDLLFRLNALEIYIPPLRERPDDVVPLMEDALRVLAADMGKPTPQLTSAAQDILRSYNWPGNVRELRNICERLVVLCENSCIDAADLDIFHVFPEPYALPQERTGAERFPQMVLPAFPVSSALWETELLLSNSDGKSRKELAAELGVSRTTLWRMLKRRQELQKQAEESDHSEL